MHEINDLMIKGARTYVMEEPPSDKLRNYLKHRYGLVINYYSRYKIAVVFDAPCESRI